MKKGSIHINTVTHGPKGSALILVVVLTVLLAAVGVLFLMTSRIDEMATSGILRTRELRAGVNVVVDRIRTVLTDDLFGGDDFLLDGNGTDEYWDYPGDDDPWLASLEPIYDPGNTLYEWPHITDLYGHISAISGFYEVDDPSYPVSTEIVTQIIADNEPVGDVVDDPSNPTVILPWGTRADADGDGVADSRWIALPGISSSQGENIYAAVRIIDNCGMININTAYRDPTGTNPFLHPTEGLIPGDWDGSLLAHINLGGIISSTDAGNLLDVTAIQTLRYGNITPPNFSDYENDLEYEFVVSRQILNHVPGYLPFDIGDELELRNRYFLTSFVNNRFGYTDGAGFSYGWPVTFDPGTGTVGKRIPYVPGDNIVDWFDKVSSPIDPCNTGVCNRRHISTTYSFDRVIMPRADTIGMPFSLLDDPNTINWYDWTNWDRSQDQWTYRPICINDYGQPGGPSIEQIAAAIWLGLPDAAAIQTRFGPDYDREILACQYAVNLIDYQDTDGDPCNPDDDEPTYLGITLGGENIDFFGIENTEAIKRHTIFVSELGYVDDRSDINPDPTVPDIEYFAIELINPDLAVKDLTPPNDYRILLLDSNGLLLMELSLRTLIGLQFPVGEIFILTNDAANFAAAFGSSYNIGAPGVTVIQVGGLTFTSTGQIVVLKENWPTGYTVNMPVDLVDVPNMFPPDTTQLRARNNSISSTDILPRNLWTNTTADPCTLGTAPPLAPPGTDYVQIRTGNPLLRNLGQIEKAFAVGYYHNTTTGQYHTLFEQIENSITDTENGINMRSYGRINLTDSDYWDLLKYLTYFNPFSDSVDNDGNGPADEDEELAVAGRININTAPWFVIKQLPWIALQNDASTDTVSLAQAIVAWRDKEDLSGLTDAISGNLGPDYSGPTGRENATGIPAGQINENLGFRNIGELLQVINVGMTAPDFDIRKYLDGAPLAGPPDFSADSVDDDFEERDILFHRVSNLVTVRSDVFTAYILVRIGQNGPQKRMIAVFDRSSVFSPADRPKLVVLHPVPDPR